MNITTKYGIAKNVKAEPYCADETFTLGFVKKDDNGEYILLGFDAPVSDDPTWRFWIEKGSFNGSSETQDAELSQEDADKIKALYEEYANGKEARHEQI
jgi:hypothetical protein